MKFIFQVHKDNTKPKKILLLDRDGVVIKDTGSPYIISKLHFEIENINKIKTIMQSLNFDFCGFITNQSGVSRNIFTENQFWKCHYFIIKKCSLFGIEINFSAVNFFKEETYYRKPRSGMLEQTKQFYNISFEDFLFIGDKKTDKQAAENVGIKFLYIDNI